MPTNEPAVIADGEMICGDVIEDNNNINNIRKVSPYLLDLYAAFSFTSSR